MITTFIFVSVILGIKYKNGSKEDGVNAFTVGITLTGMIITAGPISGGAINPAVGIVQSLFQDQLASYYPDTKGFENYKTVGKHDHSNFMWLYVIGNLLGGFFAGIFANLHAGELRYRALLVKQLNGDVGGEEDKLNV